MKLYHFCNAKFLKNISHEGLTKGVFPAETKHGLKLYPMRQWLTAEPEADKQSWATSHIIGYTRTDSRLTVEIPPRFEGNLIRATDYVRTMPPAQRNVVTDWAGHEAWWLYIGTIPPEWIVRADNLKDPNEAKPKT